MTTNSPRPSPRRRYLRVEVPRKKWGTAYLYNPTTTDYNEKRWWTVRGTYCCLGHVCLRLGVPARKMRDLGLPYELASRIPSHTLTLLQRFDLAGPRGNTTTARELAAINDSSTLSLKEKEAKIKKLGLSVGIKFIFTGTYPRARLRAEARQHAEV